MAHVSPMNGVSRSRSWISHALQKSTTSLTFAFSAELVAAEAGIAAASAAHIAATLFRAYRRVMCGCIVCVLSVVRECIDGIWRRYAHLVACSLFQQPNN